MPKFKKPDPGSKKKAEDRLAEVIAEHFPQELIDEAVSAVIEKCVLEFNVDAWDVKKLMDEIIRGRAQELLKTKYAAQVDEIANRVVVKGLSSVTLGR